MEAGDAWYVMLDTGQKAIQVSRNRTSKQSYFNTESFLSHTEAALSFRYFKMAVYGFFLSCHTFRCYVPLHIMVWLKHDDKLCKVGRCVTGKY